jgi:RNA polymerase sigma-70 factor (ECF subfamily)
VKSAEEFESLLERHKRILYKVCHGYCRNRDDREDLAQEIVIQLWRSFGGFDGRCAFSTWMYRVALNVAMSFYRRENARARHELSDTEALLQVAEENAEPPELEELHRFIAGLDELNKALILLYLDGHSYLEIAGILGLSETNVGTKLNRLKQTIRTQLKEK